MCNTSNRFYLVCRLFSSPPLLLILFLFLETRSIIKIPSSIPSRISNNIAFVYVYFSGIKLLEQWRCSAGPSINNSMVCICTVCVCAGLGEMRSVIGMTISSVFSQLENSSTVNI